MEQLKQDISVLKLQCLPSISCDSSNGNVRDTLLTNSFTAQLQKINSLLGAKFRNYKPSLETWHFSQAKSNY